MSNKSNNSKRALDTQIGGNYYKNLEFQPVELFAKTKCTPFQANIWKYISRYKYKNKEEDIKKCMHYAELAKELKCNGELSLGKQSVVEAFCRVNKLTAKQYRIVIAAFEDNYDAVIKECASILLNDYHIMLNTKL